MAAMEATCFYADYIIHICTNVQPLREHFFEAHFSAILVFTYCCDVTASVSYPVHGYRVKTDLRVNHSGQFVHQQQRDMDFNCALSEVLNEHHIDYNLKEEQIRSLKFLCEERRHVFSILPTGYGKSDIFLWCPLVMSKMENRHTVGIVISPLLSLMRDQMQRCTLLGIKAFALLNGATLEGVVNEGSLQGDYSVIFASPESILDEKCFQALSSIAGSIAVLAFDEAHCIATWGKTFRKGYVEVRRLRCELKKVPILLLTATCTESLKEEIKKILGLGVKNVLDVIVVPDRPNVHLTMDTSVCTVISLQWYTQQLVQCGELAPKVLIFCRSIDAVSELYREVVQILEDAEVDDSVVEMFHSKLDKETLEDIPKEFCNDRSHVRCLISTIAFGMGMQVPDITHVIHWGPPTSILDYWQEVGRCARGPYSGSAFLYTPPFTRTTRMVDAAMLSLVKYSKTQCIRKTVLLELKLKSLPLCDVEKCCGQARCCSYCDTVSDSISDSVDSNSIDDYVDDENS